MVASSGAAVEDEILSLLQQGDTIQAIKLYRDRMGADLATAKSVVDRLADQYGIR